MDFQLEGYECNFKNRMYKSGGDVVLYVHNDLRYNLVESKSICIEGVMECISIEISIEKQKNVIVSCVYRTPASNMKTFNNSMETIFNNNKQKVYIHLWRFQH